MSDTPISGFAADTTPVAADLIVTAKSPFAPGSNKKVTWTNVFANAQPLLFPVASASAVSAASYWIGRDADGTNQTPLTTNSAKDFHAAWSPDGTRIAFASDRQGNSDICVMDADGANQKRLTRDPADDLRPTWSPCASP